MSKLTVEKCYGGLACAADVFYLIGRPVTNVFMLAVKIVCVVSIFKWPSSLMFSSRLVVKLVPSAVGNSSPVPPVVIMLPLPGDMPPPV